MYIHMYISCE